MPSLSDPASGPLSGLRVLDLSRVVAGPYAGRVFADLGADVVKLEPPEGDPSREIAPKHDLGASALWTFGNVGKRGVCVDLHKPGGVELVLDLVRRSDLVLENFRPGVLARLGLGWDAIHAASPRTVLLSINGFGADSSWRERRAYAPIVHAVAGVLDDQARYAGQPVAQINQAWADTTAALHGAVAALAALRAADATGDGQHVEVTLFEASLSTYSELGNALLDPPDDRIMNPIYDAGPNGAIATAGPIQYVWHLVREAFPELRDPTPPGADLREKERSRRGALEAWMASQASGEVVLEKLGRAGLACAPVVALSEAATGPLARERGVLTFVDDRRGGTRPVAGPPARFSHAENRIRGRAPERGEHNAEVLHEVLGYDADRIRTLRDAGVLREATASDRPAG